MRAIWKDERRYSDAGESVRGGGTREAEAGTRAAELKEGIFLYSGNNENFEADGA